MCKYLPFYYKLKYVDVGVFSNHILIYIKVYAYCNVIEKILAYIVQAIQVTFEKGSG